MGKFSYREFWANLKYNRTASYKAIFLDKDGKVKEEARQALADLKRFCCVETSIVRVNPTTNAIDSHAMAVAAGRREVFDRIQQHINIPFHELYQIKEDTYDDRDY